MKTLRNWIPYLLVLGCLLPFLNKEIHIDDANFLRLAEGAREASLVDCLTQGVCVGPHDVHINWQGTTEPAYDVLSNPAGVAWWLVPVLGKPIWLMHLWMWPWVILALWGVYCLGDRLVSNGRAAILLMGFSPMMFLAAQGFTPDIPLLACMTAGIGGFLTRRKSAWFFALLAGCAVWFRYSGLCVIPLIFLAGELYKKRVASFFVLIPLIVLLLHDWALYGELHLLAMSEFQAVSNSPDAVFLKGVALLAMLGGVGILPIVTWSNRTLWAVMIGGILGAIGAYVTEAGPLWGLAICLFSSAGAMAFSRLRFSSREDIFVTAWAVGGAVFLLSLRFAAARYWLPFLPAFVLAALKIPASSRRIRWGIGVSAALAFGLSVDDQGFAKSHRLAAERVQAYAPTGSFAGHWGFQHHLESAGWRPLEDDGSADAIHVVLREAWPQEAAESSCLRRNEEKSFVVKDRWWGPRTHSLKVPANLHANHVATTPPQNSLLPWAFSNEPYAHVDVYEKVACP